MHLTDGADGETKAIEAKHWPMWQEEGRRGVQAGGGGGGH